MSSSTSRSINPGRVDETLWEIPADRRADMRVPARVFADDELLAAIGADRSLEQLQNVATLPGIVDAALAMPDIHQGYGFPVGGVAAIELPDGVVSPGGVGFDINCGVRLLALPLSATELRLPAGGARARVLARDPRRAGAGRAAAALALGARRRPPAGAARPRRTRDRPRGGPRAHRVAGLPARRDRRGRLRPCARARRGPARHGRRRQPLHRASARRRVFDLEAAPRSASRKGSSPC